MLAKRNQVADAGVSPVIATILMVAITVVMAAATYVYISKTSLNEQPPASAVTITNGGPLAGGVKPYSIVAASSGLRWSDLRITLDGSTLVQDATSAGCPDVLAAGKRVIACEGTTTEGANDLVNAGDLVKVTGAVNGNVLRVIDTRANVILLTLVVQ